MGVRVPPGRLWNDSWGTGVSGSISGSYPEGEGSGYPGLTGWWRCTCSRAASTSACQAEEVGSIPARCFGKERRTRVVTEACRLGTSAAWVRLPPGALAGACTRRPRRARRTPHALVVYRRARHSVTVEGRVQLPSGALTSSEFRVASSESNHSELATRNSELNEARYANRKSDQAQTLESVGSTPTRATGMRRPALGRRAACKAAAHR
jgi:hypothetical protein